MYARQARNTAGGQAGEIRLRAERKNGRSDPCSVRCHSRVFRPRPARRGGVAEAGEYRSRLAEARPVVSIRWPKVRV